MTARRLLLVDDDSAFRITTAALLEQDGYRVVTAEGAEAAAAALHAGAFDLVLLDFRMPGLDGIRLAETLRQRGEGTPILMISGFGTVAAAVEALHAGADDFLTKPVDPATLSERVAQLLERRPRARDRDGLAEPDGIVGRSPALQAVFAAIELVGPTDATVLVTGETGTGKELVARAIHERSPRRSGPFIAVGSASLADGVLESELFGHVRGAFTGAVRDRAGLFESADRGTLFLDEIGDITPAMQLRLLRVLQERVLTPVGSAQPVPVDVRVIAATHRDLRAETVAGRFREDLFYRLNVFRIELPPLRERRGDVPLLVDHVLARRVLDRSRTLCAPLAMRMLQAHSWPGNVRELIAALEGALIRAGGGPIQAEHLPPEVRASLGGAGAEAVRYQALKGGPDEREVIVAALAHAGGVRSRAAEILGMGRTTLWRKLKQLGLDSSGE